MFPNRLGDTGSQRAAPGRSAPRSMTGDARATRSSPPARVLVFAHRLEIGGTQVNAIELAAHLRDRQGYDVAVLATPGPMTEYLDEHGLRYHPAPDADFHPSPARAAALRRALLAEEPDVLHVWDAPQWLDACPIACLAIQVPTVVTSMSMVVERLLPRHLPLTFGTPELVEIAQRGGRQQARLLLPPVDIDQNAPDPVCGRSFRREWRVRDDEFLVVTVSRLVSWMKAESLRDTVSAVAALAAEGQKIRFAIVGDGTSRRELDALAASVNRGLGREAVFLTGAMVDPRPAYAAADTVVGMGGSALRALAFGKPLVVSGEKGFSMPFTHETADLFYRVGMYGVGDNHDGSGLMASHLRFMLAQPAERRDELSRLGRSFVVRHFALDVVGGTLGEMLAGAASARRTFAPLLMDAVRTGLVLGGRSLLRTP
ncbi:glycosyltransferase family 4 protein [Lutibaculum baratangense]|uniref:Glycosyl transferase, group 1 n=1 Tax=Lutibaculum baratangense AMV1 TaxID=631454 RepID=V4RID3_9HYPH|nr:glycosyltransferase family 4 protein [Lutibaculum baratangense]ESR23040.1 glycosyl transferase, group 1 [Lutibaculum baratangense AMV1]